jgi:O-antigen/teichoic acid export membrane protein
VSQPAAMGRTVRRNDLTTQPKPRPEGALERQARIGAEPATDGRDSPPGSSIGSWFDDSANGRNGGIRGRLTSISTPLGRYALRDLAYLAGGTGLGQILIVASAPALTRLYTPADMGIFGAFVAFLGIGGVGACWRLELAIPAAADKRTALSLLVAALGASVISAVVAGSVLQGLIWLRTSSYARMGPAAPFAAVLGIGLLGAGTALRYWFVRLNDFKRLGRIQSLQGGARALLPLVLAPFPMYWGGLAASEVAARGVGVLGLLRRVWPEFAVFRGTSVLAATLQVTSANWRYPCILLPSAILDALASTVHLPILASLYGDSAAGWFLLAQRLAMVPGSLVGGGVADVFHGRMADAGGDPESIRRLFRRTLIGLLAIGVLVFVPLTVLAPTVAGPLFGSDWTLVGYVVAAIAPWCLASLVVSPLTRVLVVTGDLGSMFVYNLVVLTGTVACLRIAYGLGLSFLATVLALSLFHLSCYVVLLYVIGQAIRRMAAARGISGRPLTEPK